MLCTVLYNVQYVSKRKEIIFMKMKRPQTRDGVPEEEEDRINLKEQKIFNLTLFMLLYDSCFLFVFCCCSFLGARSWENLCVFLLYTNAYTLKELLYWQSKVGLCFTF